MNRGILALFEDEHAGRFEPVALTRAVASLRLGAWTHRERWERRHPGRSIALVARGAVADAERESGGWSAVNELPPGDVLFVAAALGSPGVVAETAIADLPPGRALLAGGRLVAARATGESAARLARGLAERAGPGFLPTGAPDGESLVRQVGLRADDVEVPFPGTLVDLLGRNASALVEDLPSYDGALPVPDPASFVGVHLVRPSGIRLGEGVRLDPGVVLDASEGPIVIGPRTRVGAGSVVTGPVSIGPDCRLKPLTRLANSSLGPVCRVGGEVDGSIVLGWSNKQHDGFLGHSYLGAWVNLGAATDTSDLKNDYGPVRVALAGTTIDTGERHVGSLLGDHTKTAIHTRLVTGAVIGVSCNLLGAEFSPKAVPSFCWGGDGAWDEYRLVKAVAVAGVVTARRDVELGSAGTRLLESLHAATADARRAFLAGD